MENQYEGMLAQREAQALGQARLFLAELDGCDNDSDALDVLMQIIRKVDKAATVRTMSRCNCPNCPERHQAIPHGER